MEFTSLILLLLAMVLLLDLLCSAIPFASSNPKLFFQYLFTQLQLCFLSQPVKGALQATPWFSSSLSPDSSPQLGRQLHQGSWFSPQARREREEPGGARNGANPVVHRKELRWHSSWICLEHSLIKGQPTTRKKEGLSGKGYLELPIQALQQRPSLKGLRVLFCVIWLIKKPAHKQGGSRSSGLGTGSCGTHKDLHQSTCTGQL